MSELRLRWHGDVEGFLALGGDEAPVEVGSSAGLLEHLQREAQGYSEEELDLLGGFALFLCLREVRVGRAGLALVAAERALAALAPEDGSALDESGAFARGVTRLKEHLHGTRNEPYHVLAFLSLLFLRRRLGEPVSIA